MSTTDVVIQSEGLTRFYGPRPALRELNLQVRRGEIFGFLGPNGAGKTTFIKILLDFIRPTAGNVSILGAAPAQLDRAKLGYLPERINIHPFLTGREFLLYQCRLLGLPAGERAGRVNRALERVEMSADADVRVGNYSKGMMQRIGVASAVLGDPELLLLDEPVSGLDPIGIARMREIMLEEKQRGATILVNSHQLLEVEKTCDRVAILNKGRVAAQGAQSELNSSKGVRLELDAMTPAAAQLLQKLDPAAKIEGARAELAIADREQERLLPAKLVEQGARILSYAERRESLEEVFYRLVNESDAESAKS
jgi:ABC-2 type transport system ATP-binding protein